MRERAKTPSSAAPLHWGSSAQLRCPHLSRGSRPRGRYLAPGGEGGESAGGRLEADRSGRKGKTALAERRARPPGRSLQKTRLRPSRPSGLRKYSGDWRGTEATGGLPFPEGGAGLRLLLPAIPARQAFPLLAPPPVCCCLGRNYSSQEASRKAAWKWAAWKSLGPPELAASLANGAGPAAAVVGPAGRAAVTPRYVASGPGAASLKGGGESVSPRTPRVSAGWRPGGRPSMGTGCGGRRRWDSRPPDLTGPVPAWLNFRDVLPSTVWKSMEWESGSGGFASCLCHSGAAI